MKLFDVRSDFVAESQISVGHKAFFKTSDKILFVFVIKIIKVVCYQFKFLTETNH